MSRRDNTSTAPEAAPAMEARRDHARALLDRTEVLVTNAEATDAEREAVAVACAAVPPALRGKGAYLVSFPNPKP